MNRREWVALALLTTAIIALLVGGNPYYQGLAVTAGVFAILGLSLNLVYGYLGYISFGHAAFFGLSGYVAGLLTIHVGTNYWLAALLATIPATILGVLVGFASLRIGGAYFAITSLTVAEILRLIADNWIELTRGPMGLVLRRPKIRALEELGVGFNEYYLIIVTLSALACFLAIAFLMKGPIGRAWIAVRESRELAESLGIETLFYRVLNLAMSGFLAGLAGALLVPRILVLSPDLLGPVYSATGLLIVVLGGKGTLVGPLIGGTLFAGLPEMLRVVDEYRLAIFAILLLAFIRMKPDGIAPLVMQLLQSDKRKPTPARVEETESVSAIPSAPSEQPLLNVSNLTKHYAGLTAINSVSFRVKQGELVGFMGPNGAGKSTCLGLLSGFIRPNEGTVTFRGLPVTGLKPNQIAALGMVRTFQHTTLFRGVSVFDNVVIAAHQVAPRGLAGSLPGPAFRHRERLRQARAWRVLRDVGLESRANEFPDELPYGEQRLLSVAIALAAGPQLLLLDEPAAGLNPVEADNLAKVLRRVRDSGITIFLVEHNVRMMVELCDRIIVVHHGQKIGEGHPVEIQSDAAVRGAYFGTETADA